MCLADYKMAQRTGSRRIDIAGANALIPANPTRLRLIVSATNGNIYISADGGPLGSAIPIASVGYNDGAGGVLFGQTLVMRVEDYGTILLGGLRVNTSVLPTYASVVEVYALPDLDHAIQGNGE